MWKSGSFLLAFLSCVYGQVVASAQDQSPSPLLAAQVSTPSQPVAPKNQATKGVTQLPVEPAISDEYVSELYKLGMGWHPAALRDVPKDKYGLADWVEMMNRKLIRPRGSIERNPQEFPPFNLEIVMPAKTGLIEGAHFPHSTHTEWLGCESCHDKIFVPKIGANNLTMSRIARGEACGVCHGKVSFPLNHCERCHKPQSQVIKGTTTRSK